MPFTKSPIAILFATVAATLATLSSSHGEQLRGHWKFDEAAGATVAVDEVGDNNGTVLGSVTTGVAGIAGNAYEFGGTTSDYVSMGDATFLATILETGGAFLNQFTISAWVNFTTTGARSVVFAGWNGNSTSYVNLAVEGSPATTRFWHRGSGAPNNPNIGPTINDGNWHHLVAVVSQEQTKVYVDNVLQLTETFAYGPIDTTNNFEIGRLGRSNFTDAFAGLIDDVQVYSGTLDATDIAFLFSNPGKALGEGADSFFEAITFDSGAGMLELRWTSQEGKVYDILSATDLSANPATWPVVAEAEGIAATPPTNTMGIPKPADPTRFYVVQERNPPPPPPVFSADFESIPDPDWTTGANPGDAGNTVWERGAPTADLGDQSANGPTTGASGSATCFGTNLTATYGSDTDIYLRSPAIDLTSFDGGNTATLSLQYFIDTDLAFVDPDVGRIRVLNANNLSQQLGADMTGADGLGAIGTDWIPFSEPLPQEALGQTIVLEFQFISNGDEDNFGGFYIDEVMVEVE